MNSPTTLEESRTHREWANLMREHREMAGRVINRWWRLHGPRREEQNDLYVSGVKLSEDLERRLEKLTREFVEIPTTMGVYMEMKGDPNWTCRPDIVLAGQNGNAFDTRPVILVYADYDADVAELLLRLT